MTSKSYEGTAGREYLSLVTRLAPHPNLISHPLFPVPSPRPPTTDPFPRSNPIPSRPPVLIKQSTLSPPHPTPSSNPPYFHILSLSPFTTRPRLHAQSHAKALHLSHFKCTHHHARMHDAHAHESALARINIKIHERSMSKRYTCTLARLRTHKSLSHVLCFLSILSSTSPPRPQTQQSSFLPDTLHTPFPLTPSPTHPRRPPGKEETER